jgi:sulfate permease, SulP family
MPPKSGAVKQLSRYLPFLSWFPMNGAALRGDLVAGITVALVLVPQSMAYAQLAGMPPVYGLYTAFLPVMVAAIFGSSHHLATGPVAVVSLLTASALGPIAASASADYVALAIALALLVGIIQLSLGLLRLGVVVNFLSHPVIVGFTNAAAIIIALSQVNKILGVPMGRSGFFLGDVWGALQQVGETHFLSALFGAGSLAAMVGLRRCAPRLPGILIVVAACTALSAWIGFERNALGTIAQIANPEARTLAADYADARQRIAALTAQRAAKTTERRTVGDATRERAQHAATLGYQAEVIGLEIEDLQRENRRRLRLLRKLVFEETKAASGAVQYAPASGGARRWRIQAIDDDGVHLAGGGEVVGTIPAGLPAFGVPRLDWATLSQLLSAALVIALVGFMEAISIAKAIAARTRQRLDANQELVGQGLANIVGAFTRCFPASGSFSRSAVNFASGARSGLSSVVAAAIVTLTLLFLTPLLYHLPQAVLAAVIMLAAFSLVDFRAIAHAWRAQRHDGIAGAVTFVATIAVAPHLDLGILIGGGLAVLLFLYRTMRPRVAILGRDANGVLRDAALHGLPLCDYIVAVRFDGQLYFANVPYFEDSLLGIPGRFPKVREILVVGDGINQLDASGDESVRLLAERLRDNGVTLSFSGLKQQVTNVLAATGTLGKVGIENVFVDENRALAALAARVTDVDFAASACPLLAGVG